MDRKNMLDLILDTRLENVDEMSKYDLKILTQKMDESRPFSVLMDYIENLEIPDDIRVELSNKIFEWEGNISTEFEYFTNKYYKLGFSDAVNIIFDAKEYKKTGEK